MQISLQEIRGSNLIIDRAEVLRYLRLPRTMPAENLPQPVQQQLLEAEQAVLQAAEPRFVWQEFSVARDKDGIHLQNTTLVLPGENIAAMLRESSSCLLLAATIGLGIDELIRRTEISDMSRALMLDAVASAAVENLCNQVQAALAEKYSQKQLYLTTRFSPGYGDLPINLQKNFCNTLDCRRRIGLSVSSSGILLPRKSVTAVIGLKNKPSALNPQAHNCSDCNMQDNCPYRKANQTCTE